MNFALLALAVTAGVFVLDGRRADRDFPADRKTVDDIRRIDGRLDELETEL